MISKKYKEQNMNFKLTSKYQPTGDQPQAIRTAHRRHREQGEPGQQVLLGVTGSGRDFHSGKRHCQRRKANPRAQPQQDSCSTVVPGNEKFLFQKML